MFNAKDTNTQYVQLPPCVDQYGHKFILSYPPDPYGVQYQAQAVCEKCGHIRKNERKSL